MLKLEVLMLTETRKASNSKFEVLIGRSDEKTFRIEY